MNSDPATAEANNLSVERAELLLKRFALAARAHHEALESLDEERAEAQARMVSGLHVVLLRAGRKGEEQLLSLVDSRDPVVAGMAAVFAIRLDTGRCLKTLQRVAAEPGLLGFRASAAIQRWESGEWDPQESEP